MADASILARPLAKLPVDPPRLGAVLTLVGLAVATVSVLIGVFATSAESGAGKALGFGITVMFAAGIVASALACLRRRRIELFAILGVIAAMGALDLVAVGLWRGFDGAGYGKTVLVFFVWSLALLLMLSLVLAAPLAGAITRILRHVSYAGLLVAAAVTTWISYFDSVSERSVPFGSATSFAPLPADSTDSSSQVISLGADSTLDSSISGTELRVLSVAVIVGIAAWLGTVTASRLERAAAQPR